MLRTSWDIDLQLLGLEFRLDGEDLQTIGDQACKCWSEMNWFGCFKAIDDLSDPQSISVTCHPSSNKLQAQLAMMASSPQKFTLTTLTSRLNLGRESSGIWHELITDLKFFL